MKIDNVNTVVYSSLFTYIYFSNILFEILY